MSLLVTSEIVGLFDDTLTADDKYSFLNNGNFSKPIQMQLSKKTISLPSVLLHF